MKQVFIKDNRITVEDVSPPAAGDTHVLVANACSVISTGTETTTIKQQSESLPQRVLHHPELIKTGVAMIRQQGVLKTWQGIRDSNGQGSPLGYSSAGTVMSVGRNVVDIDAGTRVACGGLAYHAEIVSVPRNLVARIPPDVSFEEASFATIGSIAMHSVRRASIQFGETMVFLGLGLVGLLAIQIAKAGGYKVIGFDTNEDRIELARQLGIEHVFAVGRCDPVKVTRSLTNGFGADAVGIYIAGKSSDAVNLSFDLCRPRGKVVIVGSFPMNLDRSRMYVKELELLMSTSYGPGRYDPVYEEQGVDYPVGHVRWTENRNMEEFLSLLGEKRIQAAPLISSMHSIEQAPAAFQKLAAPEARPAVLFKYDSGVPREIDTPAGRISLPERGSTVPVGKTGIAVIGAGDFVQNFRLPAIKKLGDRFYLRSIVTAHGEKSKYLADKYGADYSTTDYQEVLADHGVDLIMIGTRHNLHYPIIMDALNAGKRLFVEKPLCLRREELDDITRVVLRSGLPVTVGFNRRYSPLAVTMKQILEKLPGPRILNYRVNTGAIPEGHWTLDPEVGGGRIIGEACHFFDLFNFLVGTDLEVSDIHVKAVPVNGRQVAARDNIVATVTYSDGSIASLTYTTLGSPKMEKERMELFAGNSSFVLHDYRWLESYGFSLADLNLSNVTIKHNRINLPRQDKGQEQEMRELARFLQGDSSRLISYGEIVKAMDITFRIEELCRTQ